ncbi:uncharacterized protein HMPREF1541_03702 [Cyphellophora europaea CBS 101466]|uniref:Uncharacterized protein n=1 Tax=Cyphellophora europaea (strain CBS 101466) TaxID=1220924 RepID=W2RZJ4_CYPE1|nr:uncharacterized protein HMPREF1541_03702 [Cyphellophora europaea CBS 101466]ETN41765.1 hypothetical protein HMPREF1541_03702 [Cyphellophora europaea CBS 101466]
MRLNRTCMRWLRHLGRWLQSFRACLLRCMHRANDSPFRKGSTIPY